MKQRIIAIALTVAVSVFTHMMLDLAAYVSRDRLPVGTVTSKDVIAEYYEPFKQGKDRYWLAITSPDGNMCTSVVVDEEVWVSYEIGDVVTKWGANK